MVVHTCNSSYLEAEAGGLRSKASLGKRTRSYLRNKLKAKGLGGSSGTACA
jgi:hypothetical protein